MGKCIAEFGGYFCEWSTIVDAPTTELMTLPELRRYIKARYGNEGVKALPERLKRVKATGTSFVDGFNTKASLLEYNRAGENEAQVSTEAEMVRLYRREP